MRKKRKTPGDLKKNLLADLQTAKLDHSANPMYALAAGMRELEMRTRQPATVKSIRFAPLSSYR